MKIVLLAELVLTSVRLALSLKVIFTQLILSSVQIVVLAQMYVLLKQFTQLNNTIPNNKDKGCFPNGKQPLFISFQTFGKL
ncbi:ferredoxin domain protein [Bacteroides fragilis str. Ds-233]|nr:ferredoxin domain protein [Bacteroides fragilis str. Ds-233]